MAAGVRAGCRGSSGVEAGEAQAAHIEALHRRVQFSLGSNCRRPTAQLDVDRAGGKHYPSHRLDRGRKPFLVGLGQTVGDDRGAGPKDPARGLVGDHRSQRGCIGGTVEAAHQVSPVARRRDRSHARRGGGGLDQDALIVQLLDADALHHPLPGNHLLLEAGGDAGCRMDGEVAAELGVAAEAAAAQERWGRHRAGGDDD
jgi:hypothetical protein